MMGSVFRLRARYPASDRQIPPSRYAVRSSDRTQASSGDHRRNEFGRLMISIDEYDGWPTLRAALNSWR